MKWVLQSYRLMDNEVGINGCRVMVNEVGIIGLYGNG